MKQIVIEGVVGVQSGQNPRILEEKLKVFLSHDELLKHEEKEQEEASLDEA
jgi:chemotaxis protein MotA